MGFLMRQVREQFEEDKPESLKADIRMISGCEDAQTSADVSNVSNFQLPDPAGRAGGACTSTLLSVLYKDHHKVEEDLSFVQVLEKMREILDGRGFSQIPQVCRRRRRRRRRHLWSMLSLTHHLLFQLTASHPIDVNVPFDLVPESATGTRRALLM